MKQLKELRELKGWTQEQMSINTGIPLNSIKNWESGRNPGIKNKHMLNKLFMSYGLDKIMPTAEEVNKLLSDPDIYNKVSDIIIESGGLL